MCAAQDLQDRETARDHRCSSTGRSTCRLPDCRMGSASGTQEPSQRERRKSQELNRRARSDCVVCVSSTQPRTQEWRARRVLSSESSLSTWKPPKWRCLQVPEGWRGGEARLSCKGTHRMGSLLEGQSWPCGDREHRPEQTSGLGSWREAGVGRLHYLMLYYFFI